MNTNVIDTNPVDKKKDLNTINNFLRRLIIFFQIETVKQGTKALPACGGIYEGSPLIAKDWVTVQVTHDCLSSVFVEFINKRLNPILVSKNFSLLKAEIVHDKSMAFAVDFDSKAITPHNLPIVGDEALFNLFQKNWIDVYQKNTYFGKNDLKKSQSKSKLTFDEKRERKVVMKNLAPVIKKELKPLLLEAGLHINNTISTGMSVSISTKVAKGVEMGKALDMIDGFLETKYGKKSFEINPSKTKGVESGYSISFSYDQVRKLFGGKMKKEPAVADEKKTNKGLTRQETEKRKEEMKALLPVLKEKLVPILKATHAGSVNSYSFSGENTVIITRVPKDGSYGTISTVSLGLNKIFGKEVVKIKPLEKGNRLIGYSIKLPYNEVTGMFSGKGTTVKVELDTTTTNPAKTTSSELEEWAKGIIVKALSKATIAQLMSEMGERGDADVNTLKKFISGFTTDFLIQEIEKRVGDMKSEEKLKVIQLFSK